MTSTLPSISSAPVNKSISSNPNSSVISSIATSPSSIVTKPSNASNFHLRRASYIKIADLAKVYNIDIGSLPVRKNVVNTSESGSSPVGESPNIISSKAGVSKILMDPCEIGANARPRSVLSNSKETSSISSFGSSSTIGNVKSIHPTKSLSYGYNLCVLVGNIEMVVDKYRVDQSRVRLAEVEIGDESGTISLRARDGQIDTLNEIVLAKKADSSKTNAVVLRNCTIELYQGKYLRLAVTKWGKLNIYPDDVHSTPSPPASINRSVNLSLADVSMLPSPLMMTGANTHHITSNVIDSCESSSLGGSSRMSALSLPSSNGGADMLVGHSFSLNPIHEFKDGVEVVGITNSNIYPQYPSHHVGSHRQYNNRIGSNEHQVMGFTTAQQLPQQSSYSAFHIPGNMNAELVTHQQHQQQTQSPTFNQHNKQYCNNHSQHMKSQQNQYHQSHKKRYNEYSRNKQHSLQWQQQQHDYRSAETQMQQMQYFYQQHKNGPLVRTVSVDSASSDQQHYPTNATNHIFVSMDAPNYFQNPYFDLQQQQHYYYSTMPPTQPPTQDGNTFVLTEDGQGYAGSAPIDTVSDSNLGSAGTSGSSSQTSSAYGNKGIISQQHQVSPQLYYSFTPHQVLQHPNSVGTTPAIYSAAPPSHHHHSQYASSTMGTTTYVYASTNPPTGDSFPILPKMTNAVNDASSATVGDGSFKEDSNVEHDLADNNIIEEKHVSHSKRT